MSDSSINPMKKRGFLLPFDRIFTRPDYDAYDLIHFTQPDAAGDEISPALECPDNWSQLSTEILAEHATRAPIPSQTKTVEENTVPSWLWRHTGVGKGTKAEDSVQLIFNRTVGAATHQGWKLDLFESEMQARNFYDEARYLLAQRFIAIDPETLSGLGLDWAYGLETLPAAAPAKTATSKIVLPNSTIDARLSAAVAPRAKWQKLLTPKEGQSKVFEFTDIVSDWGDENTPQAAAILDLMAFRHNDGSVNIESLRHAARLLSVLLDLHDLSQGIGFINLAPLLTALALPYDSDAARNFAASISALITAEIYATSAELAALRGNSTAFTDNRETVMRRLRNHRRAAYGDRNDYEKLSVIPAPLELKKSPDLALVAAARRRWDEALHLVREHGLRSTKASALSISPGTRIFMGSGADGITPLASLTMTQTTDSNIPHRAISPIVGEALMRLGYDKISSAAIINYIVGHGTLAKAPRINHAALQAHGFHAEALARLEDYLPNVNDIRLAFTPWVVGPDFCRNVLKIAPHRIENPRFDLLKHLGFSLEDIAAANTYCYGYGSAKDCAAIKLSDTAIFAFENDVTPEAQIRMAASVQSFISAAVNLKLSADGAEAGEKLLLSAWKQGLRSLTLDYVSPVVPRAHKNPPVRGSLLAYTGPTIPARTPRKTQGRQPPCQPATGGCEETDGQKSGKVILNKTQ